MLKFKLLAMKQQTQEKKLSTFPWEVSIDELHGPPTIKDKGKKDPCGEMAHYGNNSVIVSKFPPFLHKAMDQYCLSLDLPLVAQDKRS
jgi:hypothetical protein